MNWIALWEAVKEPLRLILLALVAWVITYIIPGVQDPTWNAIILLVLRFLDKWLHEMGKASDNATLTRGITQF